MRMTRALLGVLAATSLSGCAVFRSSQAPLATHTLVDVRHSCVLVLLPGIGDEPTRFSEHGFHDAAQSSPEPCDVVTVDAHFGYYRDAVVVERMVKDVLAPLRDQYDRLWLVGVSLGGYGAALLAEQHPDLIDGLVLISPFLGVRSEVAPLVERVETAGGLRHYEGPFLKRSSPKRHFMEVDAVWEWMAAHSRSGGGSKLVIAWGSDDRFAWQHRVVGAALGTEAAFVLPGGTHTWDTFGELWRKVAASSPWRSAASQG